jgi:SAM-dependent methyltransferase
VARDQRWLSYGWSFVRAALPGPPAEVLEIGCGTYGGFVPALLRDGYVATGIDPNAPAGQAYRQAEFESYHPPRPADAVVASTSLHHVADLDLAADRLAAALRPGGTAVVIEWASESFDEATARWCFARLPETGPEEEPGWLSHRRDAWLASGEPWQEFHAGWRAEEGLHTGADVLRALDAQFSRLSCGYGPYFFPDLAGTAQADEQAAIDAGLIRATGIRYAGTLR